MSIIVHDSQGLFEVNVTYIKMFFLAQGYFNNCVMKIQSTVLLLLRKPNCDSGIRDLSSANMNSLDCNTDVNIFPMQFISYSLIVDRVLP